MNIISSSERKIQENTAANGKYRQAAAQWLVDKHGLHVFPLKRDKKVPAIKGWQEAATTDPEQIAKWFAKAKGNRGIGVYAEASGLIVLDTDCKHEGVNGDANLRALAGANTVDLDSTFTVQSPTGSKHYYFRGSPVKSTVGQLAKGVDVKSRGGFVVAPGSTTEKGVYKVVNQAAIADAPQWLIDTISRAYTAKVDARKVEAVVELDADASLEQALAYLADAPAAVEGEGGNSATYIVACRLKDIGISEDLALDCLDLLSDWNTRCSPPWERDELEVVVANAYRYGENSPGSDSVTLDFDEIPDEIADKIGAGPANDNGQRAIKGLDYVKASDVKQEPIEWLWPGHFAVGKIGGFAGVQGDGKSQTMCYIAATVSQGGTWPEGGQATKGKVLILSAEDDAADTTVPRLAAAGANLADCLLVNAVVKTKGEARALNLGDDLARIEKLLDQEPDVRALLIDPVSAYLGGKADAYRNTEMRALLTPLAELASRRRLAVIFVTHFHKGGKGSALSRVTDSNAFTALTRTFWMAIKEHDRDGKETGRVLFLDAKRNIGKRQNGRAYTIEGVKLPSGIETSRVVWGEEITMTPDEALAESRPRKLSPALNAAVDFLADLLARGPVPQIKVKDAADGAGHAWATVKRAYEKLGIDSARKAGVWWWSLPDAEIDHDAAWTEAA